MPTTDITRLYRDLLDAWNRRDASGMAALIAPDGHMVGFDGSQLDGPAAVKASLEKIFGDHPTPSYVGKVREVLMITADVAMLRAVAGMIPPGASDLKKENTAVQTVVAARRNGQWRVVLFQNTPAAWHGRDMDRAMLHDELRAEMRAEMRAGMVVAA